MGQIEYNFNKTNGILYIRYVGNISIERLLDYIKRAGSDKALPRVLKVLEDRREGNFNFSIRENIRISKFAVQFAKNYNKAYMAAVNTKPKETAFAIDYQIIFSKLSTKQTSKAFTTFEAAEDWLLSR